MEPPQNSLEDSALLIEANLIHEHLHRHAAVTHAHPHEPAKLTTNRS